MASAPFEEFQRSDTLSLLTDEGTPDSSPPLFSDKVISRPRWGMLIPAKHPLIKADPIFITGPEFSFGRSHLVQPLSVVSINHFILKFGSDSVKTIVDVSTNGIFVNQKKLQKHIPQHIKDGDVIALKLSHSFADALILEFLDISNCDEARPEVKEAAVEIIDKEALEPVIMCPICHLNMLEPVAVYPCIHSFCGHCFAKYHLLSNNSKCPMCSLVFVGFQWNRELRNIIDKVTEPSERSDSELQEAEDLRGQLQKAIDKKNKPKSSANSPPHRPVTVNNAPYSCRACSGNHPEASGIECLGVGAPHAKCSMCNEGMPDSRQIYTFCAFCGKDFCSFLWPCQARNATVRFNQLREFAPMDFPADWQYIDPIENVAYKKYLIRHKWKAADLYRHCVARLERGDFNWDASSVATRSATIDSYACYTCMMNVVFPEFGMFHRLTLRPRDLVCAEMPHVRPYCPDGRRCFDLHNAEHKKDYNHWCPPGMLLGD